MKINGLTIPHPVVFQKRREPEHRVGAGPTSRPRRTLVSEPKAPKAKYAMPVAAIAVAATSFIAGATIATAAGATVAAMVAGAAMMVGAAILASQPEKVLPTEDLLAQVWGAEFAGQPQVVYVHIRWLREKLETDPGRPKRILTVRGVGYKLVPQ